MNDNGTRDARVYALALDDGFYIGYTRDISTRLAEHKQGLVMSTKGKSPRLVWFSELLSVSDAKSLEETVQQDIKKGDFGHRLLIRKSRELYLLCSLLESVV